MVYEYCWYLLGLEQRFMDRFENPAPCETRLDNVLRYWTDFPAGYMAELGDLIDVVTIGANLGAFDPGGGYVFNNAHNVQVGAPPHLGRRPVRLRA